MDQLERAKIKQRLANYEASLRSMKANMKRPLSLRRREFLEERIHYYEKLTWNLIRKLREEGE